MADGFRATIEGDKEFEAKLASLRSQISGILEEATLAGAEVIKDQADHLAPAPHIETEIVESTHYQATADIGPDEDHWYYRFLETGAGPHEITAPGLVFTGMEGDQIVRVSVDHHGMAARPFLRSAHDEKQAEATEATGQTFLEIINKHLEK